MLLDSSSALPFIFIFIGFYICPLAFSQFVEDSSNPCTAIEDAFKSVAEHDEKPICQCIRNAAVGQSRAQNGSTGQQFWVGCTRQKMPAVFRALVALNETHIPHLHLWDSLINILPNDFFTKIHFDRLTIERSRVGVIRKGAFANVGGTLKSLNLRNNILRTLEERALADLGELRQLDLSGNKLSEVRPAHFANMVQLETLGLSGNQISKLEDALFEPLAKLKMLNLANNRLKQITKDTFKGLDNLEVLNLNGNAISSVHPEAFVHMKALKVLDLGANNITKVEIRGNSALERLILTNNSIVHLDESRIEQLASLRSLQLGNNRVQRLSDTSLSGLAQSGRLEVLSLDGNNISRIDCHAFSPVPDLAVLSMQRNQISSLSCSASHDPISLTVHLDRSVLHPLQKLRRLILSHNELSVINEDDLTGLQSLQELSLDHNQIRKIAKNAFLGLPRVNKLYLDHNRLYFLPRGVFAEWNPRDLLAVDISVNNWECICGVEWIGDWLAELGDASTPSGTLGCLVGGNCQQAQLPLEDFDGEEPTEGKYDAWIRLLACLLAFVAILFLVIAGYVYMQESRQSLLTRTSSDTIRLIPSVESLFAFPNPILGADPAKQAPMVPSIVIQAGRGGVVSSHDESENGAELAEKSAKRVRFNE